MIQKRIIKREKEREREGGGKGERERERELCCIWTYDTKETNMYVYIMRNFATEREREWERGEKVKERENFVVN